MFEIVSGLWERPLLDDLMGGASFSPSADGGASVFLLSSGFGDSRGGCKGPFSACCDDGRISRGRIAGVSAAVQADVLPPLPVSPPVRLCMESRDCAPGRDESRAGIGGRCAMRVDSVYVPCAAIAPPVIILKALGSVDWTVRQAAQGKEGQKALTRVCLLYTSPSPRD